MHGGTCMHGSVHAFGCACLGCACRGHVSPGGACIPGERACPGGQGACPGSMYPTHAPLWTEFLTHACENITFPQLLLRAVIMAPHDDIKSTF